MLISALSIKCSVNFCNLNFHYFDPNFSIPSSQYLRKRSILSAWSSTTKQWNCVELEVARFLHITPFISLRKELGTKYPSQILSSTLFQFSHQLQVLFLCERPINFLHFKMLPSLSHKFPLFKSHLPLNLH